MNDELVKSVAKFLNSLSRLADNVSKQMEKELGEDEPEASADEEPKTRKSGTRRRRSS